MHGDASNSAVVTAPWYLPGGDEIEVFDAAYAARLPVLLKGPTGCGKARFVEHMAWRIWQRQTPGTGDVATRRVNDSYPAALPAPHPSARPPHTGEQAT